MAIENAKTLNVRIKNKYDSYENWAASGLVLEAGEIAIAYTTVNVEIGNGKIEQHPELLMKVGDGTKTFANLPWLSAKAADVAAWAKAATKPTYEANEITGMEQYIANYVETEMGISVDTDTQYQIVKVDDYNYKLQSKGKSDEAWADVADSVIVIPNDTAAIEALETLVGEKAVATQISEAIAALDLANTYAAKSHTHVKADITDFAHTHTKSEITDFAHTHEMAEVNGLVDALAGKEAAGEAQKVQTALNEYKTSNDAAVAKVAEDLASEATTARAAEKANADAIDALEAKVGEVTEGKTVVQMIADAQTNATYDDTDVKADIAALEALVGDKKVSEAIDAAVAAEAEIARAAEKKNAEDITALAGRVTTNENNIATLNGNSSVEGSVDKKIADAFNDFATKISDDQIVNTYKELIDYAASHSSDFTELVGEVDANTKAIETLNGDAATVGSVDKKIADAIAAENLAQYATDDELNTLAGRVTDVENAIGTASVEGGAAATGLHARIETAEADIDALESKVGDKSVSDQITAAIDALKIGDYAKAADLTAAINQHNTDKAALETEIAKKANDADLAAIAKTGSTDDLVQGAMTLIFDCGTSAV